MADRPDAGVGVRDIFSTAEQSFGAFLNAVLAFVLIAVVVYFFVVMPYTKAKEQYFPAEEAASPPTSRCSRRSATCSRPKAPDRRPEGSGIRISGYHPPFDAVAPVREVENSAQGFSGAAAPGRGTRSSRDGVLAAVLGVPLV